MKNNINELLVTRKTKASVDEAKEQITKFTKFLNLETNRLSSIKLPTKREMRVVSNMMKKSALDGNKTKMPGIKLPNWLGAVGWGAALFTFGAWGPKLFPGLTNEQERAIAEAPGTPAEKIAALKKQKSELNWFQKNVQGMGSEIDEQIYALETGDVKSYGYNMTPKEVKELKGKNLRDEQLEEIRSAGKKEQDIDVERFEKTVNKFSRLAKRGIFSGRSSSSGLGRQRTNDNSGDGVIEVGDIKPGGRLDFRGDGSGIGGKLVMHDGAGKKVGSWTATSGVYRTANSSQADRKNISGGYMPLPDGTYPLMGFDKHGPWPGLPGIGHWSAYINNTSGSIGARGGIMLHNDIGSNGTQGCIGVELGGTPGTPAEEEFLAAYEQADPTSVRVNIAKNANVPEEYEDKSDTTPKATPDNAEDKTNQVVAKTTAESTTQLTPETKEILSNAERRAKVVNKETGQTQGQVEDMQLRNQKIEAMRKALGRDNFMQQFLDRQMGNTGNMAIENFSKMMTERGLGERLKEINAMQHKNHVDESVVDTPDVESDVEDIQGVLEDTATVTSRRTENTVPEQYASYNNPRLNSTVFNIQNVPPAMPPSKPGMMIAGNQGGSGAGYSPGYSATDAFAQALLVQLSGS